MQRLTEIPGVGPMTVSALVAAIGDRQRPGGLKAIRILTMKIGPLVGAVLHVVPFDACAAQ